MPTSTGLEIGGWMVTAAAVIGIVVLILTLVEKWRLVFGPKEKYERWNQPVTRYDFEQHLKKSDEDRDKLLRDFTERIERMDRRLTWNTTMTVRITERLKIDLHRENGNPDL